MQNSIYTPLSGALAQEKLLDVIANNLANVNTPGFKGEAVSFSLIEPELNNKYVEALPPAPFKQDISHLYPLVGNDIAYSGVTADIQDDNSQGPPIQTQNPTDIMIEGKGMLQVQTPEGERYTRAGNLRLSSDGVLSTQQGHAVMGHRGAIVLNGTNFQINSIGEVYQDGHLVDRLQVFEFSEERALERVGNNYYFHGGTADERQTVSLPRVRQGFVEGSNVNAIKNLTAMILAHRSFEAYQKTVTNFDRMMEKSSNSIGEVRG